MAHVEDRRWSTDPKTGERRRTRYNGPSPWRARYRTPDGLSRAKGFTRKVDAERFLTAVEGRKLLGEYVDPTLGRTTFADVAQEWLGTVSHLKPKTLAGYESILSKHILPTFGSLTVAAIETTAVRRFASRMMSGGASHQTTKNTLNVLRAVLATAVESRMLASNPAAGIRLDKAKARAARRARERARVFLAAEQVAALVEAMPNEYGLLVLFAAYTGLRSGEIAALKADDLDLVRRRVHVRRAVEEVHGALVVGDPKNGEPRTVTLPAFLAEDLAAHLLATGRRGEAWLFRAPEGEQLRHSNFYRRVFRPVAERAGMPDGLRFHDLRHTCAALLIASGAHPKAIQERLGHSSIEITMDTYGHLYESVEESLAEALDGIYREAAASSSRPARPALLR